jgi:hypothetical protein
MNSEFIDLFNDGSLELLSVGEYPPPLDRSLPSTPMSLYRLVAGQFTPESTSVLFASTFRRNTGAPQSTTLNFAATQNATRACTLRIVNGNKTGQNRVSSASIMLNGETVASPSQFNQQVEFITVPITVQDQNALQVLLAGAPAGTLIVDVECQIQ